VTFFVVFQVEEVAVYLFYASPSPFNNYFIFFTHFSSVLSKTLDELKNYSFFRALWLAAHTKVGGKDIKTI
jgi:hypothetical protein